MLEDGTNLEGYVVVKVVAKSHFEALYTMEEEENPIHIK
jgi:hypothetical protein